MAKFIVVTGGPGAGKTAVLEMARRKFCKHTIVLPEAASIVFGGGFWRLPSETARMAAQRAIYHIQDEMETLASSESKWNFILCDRGTIDGLAYWPGSEESYWAQIGTDLKTQLAKYAAVIHMRTPDDVGGYNHQNLLRVETATEARAIDAKIERIWSAHPRYIQIPNFANFLDKAAFTLERLAEEYPQCCATGLNRT